MSPEVQAQHRAVFRTKFGILRGAWPNYGIPDIPETTALEEIHAQYDMYVRHIRISQNVDQYKVYLVIMWLIIELFCTKIGLSIGGYTISQMRAMNKYERLLIELGEKSDRETVAATGGAQSSWPVEVRLFFMALVNAVTFIIIKMLAGYIGEGMATTVVDALSSYLSGSPPQPGQVLFGGPNTPNGPADALPGGVMAPNAPNPMGNFDMASMIGSLGSMFLNGGLLGNTGGRSAPAQPAAGATAGAGAATPRFRPAYDE
jgi:hypothetical protein